MAVITVSASAVIDSFSAQRCNVGVFTSGCTLTKGDAVYVDSAGELQPTSQLINSGSMTKFEGIVLGAYSDGDAVTVFGNGAIISYANATLTPGDFLYIAGSGTGYEGKLITEPKIFAGPAASGSIVDMPVARAINSSDIRIIR